MNTIIFILMSICYIVSIVCAYKIGRNSANASSVISTRTHRLRGGIERVNKYFTFLNKSYPVFKTRNGNYFIEAISRNGLTYRYYLNKEQLNLININIEENEADNINSDA